MSGNARLKAYRKGRWAETAAAILLLLKGYRVLSRGYRTRVGEVDLIARKNNLLIFVEVKARQSLEAAHEAIGTRQKQRIRQAAEVFRQRNTKLSSCDCRFDVILIAPLRWPKHIPDAWRESGN